MARLLLLALCALALVPLVARAEHCHAAPQPNATQNLYPIDTSTLRLQRQYVNGTIKGKAYFAGDPSTAGGGGANFWVLHLWGATPYELGYAHGRMMRQEAKSMLTQVWQYIENQVASAIPKMPKWVQDLVEKIGLPAALDLTAAWTKPYTGAYFHEEAQGLADGAGVDVKTVWRIHMIGELTKGSCSMVGAWGAALAPSLKAGGTKTLQVRALDWDMDGPFRDFPAVIVYHINESDDKSDAKSGGGGGGGRDGSNAAFARAAAAAAATGEVVAVAEPNGGHSFANVGFVGWIGALTGMSSDGVGISEIGVSYPDATFGKESRKGTPFTFLLRDILQFDADLQAAVTRVSTANRTCNLILGAGDGGLGKGTDGGGRAGAAGGFRGFQVNHATCNVFDDTDMAPTNRSWHPLIENVVYYGMDWVCPNFDVVLARQLNKHHGALTPAALINDVLPIVQTGDLHAAVYDLTRLQLFVAFAKPVTPLGGLGAAGGTVGHDVVADCAYSRQFTRLDLVAAFAEPAPTGGAEDTVGANSFTCAMCKKLLPYVGKHECASKCESWWHWAQGICNSMCNELTKWAPTAACWEAGYCPKP